MGLGLVDFTRELFMVLIYCKHDRKNRNLAHLALEYKNIIYLNIRLDKFCKKKFKYVFNLTFKTERLCFMFQYNV